MKALLIEFDGHTGKRAGGISPSDPGLRCHGWQNLEVVPALEIRVIYDDRKVQHYRGIEGVTVLEDKAEINAAIKEHVPARFKIDNEVLFAEHLRQKKVNLSLIKGDSREVLKALHKQGIKGLRMIEPTKL